MSYFDTIKFHSESQPDPKEVHGFADQFHLDSIPPEPIDWLWPFRIPRACVSLLARTICPRLAVLGADLRRVVALGPDTFNAHGYSGPVEFPQDIRQLERFLNKCGGACRLVIIDPLAAFLGRADATSNKAIRKLM